METDDTTPLAAARPTGAYWLEAPAIHHGLCGCCLDEAETCRRTAGSFRYAMIGMACALILTGLAVAVAG
ncbi:hypothetical protein ACIREE_25745 [Streptomyces sp. NPDC102467]|uniref:hypothetical protein n=1 Tax=Streptomyces sp. NPDC102467 TaxID=3366179 RepID=UPI003813A028